MDARCSVSRNFRSASEDSAGGSMATIGAVVTAGTGAAGDGDGAAAPPGAAAGCTGAWPMRSSIPNTSDRMFDASSAFACRSTSTVGAKASAWPALWYACKTWAVDTPGSAQDPVTCAEAGGGGGGAEAPAA